MIRLSKSEYGTVAVDKDVISRLVIDCMNSMDSVLLPCNRKGKISGRKIPFISDDEAENSVEIKASGRNRISVRVYFIARFGESISKMSNELFDSIEEEMESLGFEKPERLFACVKGVLARQVAERNIEVTRYNG